MKFISVDELLRPITQEEYVGILRRQHESNYANHAILDENGEPVDADDILERGMTLMSEMQIKSMC